MLKYLAKIIIKFLSIKKKLKNQNQNQTPKAVIYIDIYKN